MNTRERIVHAACASVSDSGLAELTIGDVASRAGVSTALVHYHFATKKRLLAAACERLAALRSNARIAALTGSRGLSALDALWSVLSGAGAERAWHDLALLARRDASVRRALGEQRRAEHAAVAGILPQLFADLGAAPAVAADDTASAVLLFLDGAALAVSEGVPTGDVRTAYDAFWLVLVTAVPARGR